MKRFYCLLLALLLLLFAGCQKTVPKSTGYPIEVEGLTLENTPTRVVSLSPAITEALFILGYGGRLVGVVAGCDTPTAATSLPNCGSPLLPDSKTILDWKPDLVLSPAPLPEYLRQPIEAAGAAILVVPYQEDLDAVVQGWATLCRVFEGEETGALRARQLQYMLDTLITHLRDSLALQGEQALWLIDLKSTAATGDTMVHQLLTQLGFENAAAAEIDWLLPAEFNAEPAVVFYNRGLSTQEIEQKFQAAAEQNGLVALDTVTFERQSPRMLLELHQALLQLYPDRLTTSLPDLALPIPKPEPPPKSWWEKLLGR